MCYPVTCANCGNTGWGGCGRHLDTVMSSVPTADRCTCRQDTTPGPGPASHPAFILPPLTAWPNGRLRDRGRGYRSRWSALETRERTYLAARNEPAIS